MRGVTTINASRSDIDHSGAVKIEITTTTQPDITVQVRTVNGNFYSAVPGQLVTKDSGHDLVIGKGTATIRATTFSGPIRIERDYDVAVVTTSKCR